MGITDDIALATKMARLVVDNWETKLPELVATYRRYYGDAVADFAEKQMRELAGGEEVYVASKQFLKGR